MSMPLRRTGPQRRTWLCPDALDTEHLGGALARGWLDGAALRAGSPQTDPGAGIVHLDGELGAGKTTLARGFLRALGHEGPVKSPTYTLVEPYALTALEVFHFDLYRLDDPDELDLIGARDYFGDPRALCLVEWPQRAASLAGRPDLVVKLGRRGDLEHEIQLRGREIQLLALSDRGLAALLAMPDEPGART